MDIQTLNTADSEIFLPDEHRLIQKTLSIREKIVDEMVKDGVPTNSRDIRVLNEVLNSIDALVLGKADRRLKREENNSKSEMIEFVSSLLLTLEKKEKNIQVNREIELPDTEVLEDIVPGEDEFEYIELSLEEIRENVGD